MGCGSSRAETPRQTIRIEDREYDYLTLLQLAEEVAERDTPDFAMACSQDLNFQASDGIILSVDDLLLRSPHPACLNLYKRIISWDGPKIAAAFKDRPHDLILGRGLVARALLTNDLIGSVIAAMPFALISKETASSALVCRHKNSVDPLYLF